MYRINKKKLAAALNEAVLLQKKNYKNLTFVDEIFNSFDIHIDNIKHIIRERSTNNAKRLYTYLLEECNCSSRYDDVAPKLNYPPEETMLYDDDVNEQYGDEYYDDDYSSVDDNIEKTRDVFRIIYDREPTDEELEDFMDSDIFHDYIRSEEESRGDAQHDFNRDMALGESSDEEDQTPSFWAAYNESVKKMKIARKKLSESDVLKIKSEGYDVKAFVNEDDMMEYVKSLK